MSNLLLEKVALRAKWYYYYMFSVPPNLLNVSSFFVSLIGPCGILCLPHPYFLRTASQYLLSPLALELGNDCTKVYPVFLKAVKEGRCPGALNLAKDL